MGEDWKGRAQPVEDGGIEVHRDAPDMEKRAERLREYLESSCYKFNDESLGEAGVDLDADPPVVPHRFVTNEFDGSSTWLQFGDNLDDMRAICESLGGGEYPWVADTVRDLDTGNTHQAHYSVRLEPLRWAWGYRYRIKHDDGSHSDWLTVRRLVTAKEDAERAIAAVMQQDSEGRELSHPYITDVWQEEPTNA